MTFMHHLNLYHLQYFLFGGKNRFVSKSQFQRTFHTIMPCIPLALETICDSVIQRLCATYLF